MGERKSTAVESLYPNSDSDDCILKDFRKKTPFRCDTCSVGLENRKAYEQHMNGKKHNKLVNTVTAKLKAVKLNDSNDGSNSADDEEETGEEIECEVCQIQCSGHIPYYNHMKSKKHAKNVKKLHLKERMKDMPEVLKSDEDEDSEEDVLLPKAIGRCEPCQKVFYCHESLHQHMKSLAHKKKTQQKNLEDKFISQNNVGQNDENDYRCEICDKNFSGVVPYTSHMKSRVHQKEVSKSEAAAKVKHLYKETDDKNFFVCKECDKRFTHPKALLEHVNSNDHQKQEAKKELMEFLSQHPEIVLTKAVVNAESCDEDVALLICSLCNVSLAGPECAKQHVNSNKHKSVKIQKKIRNQIKQEKEQRNGNDKDKKPGKEPEEVNGSKNILPPQKNTIKTQEKSSEENDDFELL